MGRKQLFHYQTEDISSVLIKNHTANIKSQINIVNKKLNDISHIDDQSKLPYNNNTTYSYNSTL